MKFPDKICETLFILFGSKTAVNLPTLGVLPVQIKSIEIILRQELDNMVDESLPVGFIIHHTTVFITFGVIPSTDGKENFFVVILQWCYLLVKIFKKCNLREALKK